MKKYFLGTFLLLILIAVVLNLWHSRSGTALEINLLQGGNILMAIMSALSFYMVNRQLTQRPQAFVRGVYGGTMLKMMVFIIALVSYVLCNKTTIHKPSLFILFGIYLLYTFTESVSLSRLAKRKNQHAEN